MISQGILGLQKVEGRCCACPSVRRVAVQGEEAATTRRGLV